MTVALTPPKAQVPIATVDVGGRSFACTIHPEWLRYLAQGLFDRAGGTSGSSSNDLSASAFEDAGIEEAKAVLYGLRDGLNSTPPVAPVDSPLSQFMEVSPPIAPVDTVFDRLMEALPPPLTKADLGLAKVEDTALSTWAGSTNLTTLGTATTGTWNASTIGAAYGGTGQSSYTIGDLLYASGATALSRLAGVATGNALISGGIGSAPSWGKVGLTTHVSGTLPVANGGTGVTALSSLTANPSASVGLTAVNGSASTFMRSDGAPALSQSISPTWTGNHTFAPSSGNTTFTAGYVLVGTTSATLGAANRGVLEVNGSSSSIIGLSVAGTSEGYFYCDGSTVYLVTSAAGGGLPLHLGTNDVVRMAITSAGAVGIGTTAPKGLLGVASSNAGDGAGVTAWGNGYSVFGPNVGSTTGAALGMGYDTTNDRANILALAPNVAWKPLHLFAGGINFKAANGVTAGNINTSGNWTIGGNVGFNGTAPIAKPTITGSRGGNAALASLLTALANYGLITDSST